jgi:hypothetical protein
VNQGGGLKGVARSLSGHFVPGQFAQFLINQRQQLIRGGGIAIGQGFENTRNVAHAECNTF